MSFESKHDTRLIRLAQGTSKSLGKVKNITLSWGQLKSKLDTPLKSAEKVKEYQKMSADERNKLKGANGWYLGGHCDGGRRKKNAIRERDVLTFDLDDSNPEQLEDLMMGCSNISEFEWYAHTTRSHTPESPRLRIYVLLREPIPADQYSAATRIFAQKLDPTMDTIDHVSFRVAQLMYLPTCSKNGAFEFTHNKGKPLDVAAMLEDFGDWEDFTKLPFSEKQGQQRPSADKAENPHEKHGVIGAFCRAYDVETAIAEFLPDVYAPSDDVSNKPRYTYLLGSGANGVVVEDDGLFIYSHHGTDPCGERLCNAWDMVRLHKFSDLDEGKDRKNKKITEMPSYKAMVQWSSELGPVREELINENYAIAERFDVLDQEDGISGAPNGEDDLVAELVGKPDPSEGSGLPPQSPNFPPKPDEKWVAKELEVNAAGQIKNGPHNVQRIISNDHRTWGVIGYNDFKGEVVIRRQLKPKVKGVPDFHVEDKLNGDEWRDEHDIAIRSILCAPAGRGAEGWGIRPSREDVRDAIEQVARNWRFHPVIQWLEGLPEWDGNERVPYLWHRYLGTPDDAYHRETAILLMLAMICRCYNPGHEFQYAPIISGRQGCGKSSFIPAIVGEEWAGHLTVDMKSDKEAVDQMLGNLLMELPEIANMRRGETDDIKQFMTLPFDKVRLAYKRRQETFKRRCVFVGTTNHEVYLKDPTGNRRFWPIVVRKNMVDNLSIEHDRPQLWAEALHRYRELARKYGYKRIPLRLSSEARSVAEGLQETHSVETTEQSMAGTLQGWVDTPIRRSEFLGGFDGRRIAEGRKTDDEDPWIVRTKICCKMADHEGLESPLHMSESSRNRMQQISRAIQAIPGWSRTNQKRFPAPYYQQVAFVRDGCTEKEIKQGYRIVEAPEDDGVDHLI